MLRRFTCLVDAYSRHTCGREGAIPPAMHHSILIDTSDALIACCAGPTSIPRQISRPTPMRKAPAEWFTFKQLLQARWALLALVPWAFPRHAVWRAWVDLSSRSMTLRAEYRQLSSIRRMPGRVRPLSTRSTMPHQASFTRWSRALAAWPIAHSLQRLVVTLPVASALWGASPGGDEGHRAWPHRGETFGRRNQSYHRGGGPL